MQKYINNVAVANGAGALRAISGALITVTNLDGSAATIYDNNGGAPRTDPLLSDDKGYFAFYAADGRYTITITKTGITTISISDVLLEDPVDSPDPTFASLAAANGLDLIGFTQTGVAPTLRTGQDKAREGYVSPEDYAPDGLASGADWSDYVQKALDTGKNLWTQYGKEYGLTREMIVATANTHMTGGGIFKLLPSYVLTDNTLSALSINAPNVTIDSIIFQGTGAPSGSLNNRFIFSNFSNIKVTEKAQFLNLPDGGSNFNGAILFSGGAAYSSVIGAYFLNNPGAIFFQGRNCEASLNRIINPSDAAIALNGLNCRGCVVNGNIIDNEAGNSVTSLIAAEEGASTWVISNNSLRGIKDGVGITAINVALATPVKGGKIIGNMIDGNNLVTTNPSAGINVNTWYEDVDVSGNTIINMPTGNSNTRGIVTPASGGRISYNFVDCVNGTVGATLQIGPGTRGLTVQNNVFRQPAASQRHVLFLVGDYAGNPVHFYGGKFFGSSIGIDAELNIASITGLSLKIDNIEDSTATSILSAATLLGDRSAWMNAGAWARPHRIGAFTEMHMSGGSGTPATGTFQNGDKLYYLAPTASAFIGIVRAAGAWKTFGPTSA